MKSVPLFGLYKPAHAAVACSQVLVYKQNILLKILIFLTLHNPMLPFFGRPQKITIKDMAKEQTAVRDCTRTNLREPQRYKVIIYNDDFTTMEFVVHILVSVFFKSADESEKLMLRIHQSGSAIVGIYSYDVAISKVHKATIMAREENFPLRLECKPE